jgi:Holliday junction resolvase
MKRTENIIQTHIIKYLKDNHIFHFRYNATTSAFGLPDIIAIVDGWFVGIEVKDPMGKPTELQVKMKESIEQSGGFHIFATSLKEVQDLLENIQNYSNI